MTKAGITIAMLAAIFCLPAEAQTISVVVLEQAGAQAVLQGGQGERAAAEVALGNRGG